MKQTLEQTTEQALNQTLKHSLQKTSQKALRKTCQYGLLIIMVLGVTQTLFAQSEGKQLTQTVRGAVTDKASGEPLPYASVGLLGTTIGATTNDGGEFVLPNVPIGRHSVSVNFVGYEVVVVKEVMVGSAKEVYLEIPMTEKVEELGEVIVTPKVNKTESSNQMASVGSHLLSTDEASRFAGGWDDPGRLVSAFAGVDAPSVTNNGISVHGNSPTLLQWRLEDIEIPNPNHFADVEGLGGGFLSALSSNVLGNSNFFISAFPSEYNNAVSGVFDMKLRNGNNQKFQHTFQVGVMGIDLASEGPLSKAHNASYIFNYRYSTTGLVGKFQKDMGGLLGYQDLNFKLNFPTKKAGTFTVWGLGLMDEVTPEDVTEWTYLEDGLMSGATQKSGAAGISHRYLFPNRKTSVKSTLAATYQGSTLNEDLKDENGNKSPRTAMEGNTRNLVFTSALNHKFGARHTNKTGITVTNIHYDMNLDFTPLFNQPLENIYRTEGSMNLMSAYTSSLISLSNQLSLTLGVNGQYLTLNDNYTIEPRASVKWQFTPKSSLALGYGLHSRMEKADVYFVKDENGGQPNQDLGFIKSHHLMLSFVSRLSENRVIKIEPYFQPLYDVPVTADGTYSILNRNDFYITELLVNKGKGRNLGVDFTFEKYLSDGLYYMATASVFDSKFRTADGRWFNTRYNRNFIMNGLVGKEWMLGRRDVLSVNLRGSIMGGQQYSPVDETATMAHPDKTVQYDASQIYSKQFSPMFVGSYTVSYTMNRKRMAHEFALSSINATNHAEYIEHRFNLKTGTIEAFKRANMLTNISYRIEF